MCSKHQGSGVIVDFVENHYDADPEDTEYECTLLFIIHKGESSRIVTDKMQCGLFNEEMWRTLLMETGFDVQPLKDTETDIPELEGITLYLCIKPE